MAQQNSLPEIRTKSPTIRKIDSRFFQVQGRMNRSVDQIDYDSQKSVFMSFSDSTPKLNEPGSVDKKARTPNLGMVRIKDLLSHNKREFDKSHQKLAHMLKVKTDHASTVYNLMAKKIEDTAKNQRVNKGFFMKMPTSGMPGKGLPGLTSFSRRLLAGKLFKRVD